MRSVGARGRAGLLAGPLELGWPLATLRFGAWLGLVARDEGE